MSISGFSRSGNPMKCNSSMSNQCMTSYVTSWRHAWRQTYIRSITETTHPRTLTLVSIGSFRGQAIRWNTNQLCHMTSYNACMTSYVTSWRHALWRHTWRQTYIRSITGTTHPRTLILVSIWGFLRSWQSHEMQFKHVKLIHAVLRDVMTSRLTSNLYKIYLWNYSY